MVTQTLLLVKNVVLPFTDDFNQKKRRAEEERREREAQREEQAQRARVNDEVLYDRENGDTVGIQEETSPKQVQREAARHPATNTVIKGARGVQGQTSAKQVQDTSVTNVEVHPHPADEVDTNGPFPEEQLSAAQAQSVHDIHHRGAIDPVFGDTLCHQVELRGGGDGSTLRDAPPTALIPQAAHHAHTAGQRSFHIVRPWFLWVKRRQIPRVWSERTRR